MSQERIVNLAFVAAALLIWFIGASLMASGLDALPAPPHDWTFLGDSVDSWDLKVIGRELRLSNLLGIALGVAGGLYLWRNERIFQLAHEVAGELRKVTWPTWPEVQLSTVVVMATTVVVGVCLWAFDTVFAFLTRLVYRI